MTSPCCEKRIYIIARNNIQTRGNYCWIISIHLEQKVNLNHMWVYVRIMTIVT